MPRMIRLANGTIILQMRLINVSFIRSCHFDTEIKSYAMCYKILGTPNNADEETVKNAFIKLCKIYHPDSKSQSADSAKFQEIETAYRILQKKFSNECIGEYGLYYKDKKVNHAEDSPKIFDIKHTAPQHRQYLSFDGVGSGTPSQRQKQYFKYRAVAAAENVHDHHIKKLTYAEGNQLAVKDRAESEKIKTRYGIDRLVEDLIQESMAKGHFKNLRGQGKPLPQSNYNPYVDFTTHKMNQIMIENGFVPEWINLQRDITDEICIIREKLYNERQNFGSHPLNHSEETKWKEVVENLKEMVDKLNKKINKYNLIVPVLNNQKVHFNLEKESCDILKMMPSVEKNVDAEKERG